MKNKNPSSRKRLPLYRRPWVWVLVIIIAIALVIIAIVLTKPHETKPINTAPESAQDKPADKDRVDADTNTSSSEPENKAVQFEGEDPNELAELTGVITMKDVDAGTLTIMSSVDQYLGGICVITLRATDNSEVYKASSDLKPDITTSYCEPFAVPINNLPSGRYQIEIELSGDGKTGLITDEVNL